MWIADAVRSGLSATIACEHKEAVAAVMMDLLDMGWTIGCWKEGE